MAFTTYAQNFEDVMLWRALRHVEKGCYVDVGAQHPVIDSVSKAFYDRGWRGIHIEPVPEYARLLRQDRPDEVVLEVALSDIEGTLELNVIPETGLSTAVDAYARRHHTEHGFDCQRIHVPVLTLKSALQSLAGKEVHWLKIDVEGLEGQVLKGWDSQALRPWVMVIEATIPNSTEVDYAGWDPLLVAADYQFVYFDGLNRFYIAKEHAELAAAFSSPPNVFDDMILTASSTLCRELVTSYQARESELTARVVQAEAQLAQTDAQLAQTDAQLAQTEAQLAQTEAQLAQTEAYAVRIEGQLREVLNSRSWRVTLPLRLVGGKLHRLGAAIQDSAKPMLCQLRQRLRRQPMLRRAARVIFRLLPGAVRHCLHLVIHEPATMSDSVCITAQKVADLSPRAALIYANLKQTIDAGKN